MQIPLEEYGQLKAILSRSVEVCLATIGVCVFYASALVGAFFYFRETFILGNIGRVDPHQKGTVMYTLAFGIGFGFLGVLFSVFLTSELKLAIFLFGIGIFMGAYLDCREYQRKKEETLQAELIRNSEPYLKLITCDRSYILSQLSECEGPLLSQVRPVSMIPWTIEGMNELFETWKMPGIRDFEFHNLILAIGQTPGYQLTGEFQNHSFCVDSEFWQQEFEKSANKAMVKETF